MGPAGTHSLTHLTIYLLTHLTIYLLTQSDADSAQQQALHGKEISELQQATVAALSQRKYGCGIQGAFCMVDACGILDAKAAIVWLLYAQSISCRDWLYKIWRAALVPNTAVSSALNRYEQISNTLAPTSATMKQVLTTTHSLTHSYSLTYSLLLTHLLTH